MKIESKPSDTAAQNQLTLKFYIMDFYKIETPTTPTTIKFPDPKKIDWKKYIQPKKQISINTNKAAISILVNK